MESSMLQLVLENLLLIHDLYFKMSDKMVQIFIHKESGPLFNLPLLCYVYSHYSFTDFTKHGSSKRCQQSPFYSDIFLLVLTVYQLVMLIWSINYSSHPCHLAQSFYYFLWVYWNEDPTWPDGSQWSSSVGPLLYPLEETLPPLSIRNSIPEDPKDEWIRSTNSMSKLLGEMVRDFHPTSSLDSRAHIFSYWRHMIT